ncbi:hypothetical protein M513_11458 [Trichuris suis]|uniref:WD domain, G-beta repeat protein n=1 Tax=Trichuris suis TaxID=68888 RepID=A0A085LRS1_9BILA|nr:hypothetical protein M513_11458 [Trichuris suis]
MKAFIPSTEFYKGASILSVDFHRGCSCYKVATGAINFDVRIWELQIGDEEENMSVKQCSNLERHNSSSLIKDVTDLSWSYADELLAATTMNGSVILWHTHTELPCRAWQCGSASGLGVSCRPGGHLVVTMADNESLSIFNKANMKNQVLSHCLLPTGVDGKLENLTLFDHDDSSAFKMRLIGCISNCHSAPLTDVAFSDDGRFLATSSIDGHLSFISFSKDELGVRWSQPVGLPPKRVAFKNITCCITSCKSIDRPTDAGPSSSVVITSDSDSSTDDENGFSEVNPGQIKRTAGLNKVHSQGDASEIQIVERTGNSIRREQHGVGLSCLQNVKTAESRAHYSRFKVLRTVVMIDLPVLDV